MAKENNQRNRGQAAASGVNPQGMTASDTPQNPKSDLENRAKKSNTKI